MAEMMNVDVVIEETISQKFTISVPFAEDGLGDGVEEAIRLYKEEKLVLDNPSVTHRCVEATSADGKFSTEWVQF